MFVSLGSFKGKMAEKVTTHDREIKDLKTRDGEHTQTLELIRTGISDLKTVVEVVKNDVKHIRDNGSGKK